MVDYTSYAETLVGSAMYAPAAFMVFTFAIGLALFKVITGPQLVIILGLVAFSGVLSYNYLGAVYTKLGGTTGLETAGSDAATAIGCPQVEGVFNAVCSSSSLITKGMAGDIANLMCTQLSCGNCNYDSKNCPT